MITVTFNPETVSQASVIAQAMAQYLGATTDTPDTSEAVAHEQAKEAPAKKPKATKPAAVATPEVSAPVEPTPGQSAPVETSAPVEAAAGATLEAVRAKLTALSQGGKAPEVKALIAKFGATKLTDIPADKYAEVLAAAEGL